MKKKQLSEKAYQLLCDLRLNEEHPILISYGQQSTIAALVRLGYAEKVGDFGRNSRATWAITKNGIAAWVEAVEQRRSPITHEETTKMVYGIAKELFRS